jgi:hypothetical protein
MAEMAFAAYMTLDTEERVYTLEWLASYMPHALLTAIEGMRETWNDPDGWDQAD